MKHVFSWICVELYSFIDLLTNLRIDSLIHRFIIVWSNFCVQDVVLLFAMNRDSKHPKTPHENMFPVHGWSIAADLDAILEFCSVKQSQNSGNTVGRPVYQIMFCRNVPLLGQFSCHNIYIYNYIYITYVNKRCSQLYSCFFYIELREFFIDTAWFF